MDTNNVYLSNMNEQPVNGSTYNSLVNNNQEHPRTLYVGNLDRSINEDFIRTLFQTFGRITSLKLIDNLGDLYSFVEYEDHASAANALQTMNKRKCLQREIKVNWASNSTGTGSKADTSKHFHIFVGDLSSEIETPQLREAFSIFGEISDCRILRDSSTQKSKGYGFISFVKKQDAENAISGMNGQWLGNRSIRTNWATRKMQAVRNDNVQIGPNVGNKLKYDEIYLQSSKTNCTVYCGGIVNGLDEDIIQKSFSQFGTIQEIRVFKDKGYAFIKYTSKEAATNAIVLMHNQEILGQTVKCSWGKENNDTNMPVNQIAQNLIYPATYSQQQPLSYWYYNAGLQQNQPHYASVPAGIPYQYNQYYQSGAGVSTSQSNAYNSTSLGILSATAAWTPQQGQHQLTNNNNSIPTSHMNVPIQQTSVMSYPMQGYQAQ